MHCLNPYCNGRWSRTVLNKAIQQYQYVLILVVMEDGLVPLLVPALCRTTTCLNPCCSGRWSRTRPYKTILIINKLKNSTKQLFTFLNRKLTFSQRVQSYYYFSRYASQLFLNIQPFPTKKFNSINYLHPSQQKRIQQ